MKPENLKAGENARFAWRAFKSGWAIKRFLFSCSLIRKTALLFFFAYLFCA